MRAARLRHRVIPQSQTQTYDTFNHPTKVWSNVLATSPASLWAAVEVLRSDEAIKAGAEAFSTLYRVLLRYSTDISGIDNSWRLVWGTKNLAIKSILDPDGQNRPNTVIELICEEGLQDG